MNIKNMSELILSKFREKEIMKDLSEEEDFFDLGVSSLTIVELQIVVEKELKLSVSTSELMAAATVKEWAEIFIRKAQEQPMLESNATVS